MTEVKVHTLGGNLKGVANLPEEIFSVKLRENIAYEAMKAYLANQRLGVASAKTRSQVRGGGRKPFRQKGTGRARQGTRRSPLMPGGGVVFGPRPRNYRMPLAQGIRHLALFTALSEKAREGKVCVVEKPTSIIAKTKVMRGFLQSLGIGEEHCLLIHNNSEGEIKRASKNIPNLWVEDVRSLSAYPVLWADRVILCEGVAERIREVYLR